MHIETIESVDYFGNPRKQDYYFLLDTHEVSELQLSSEGGLFERMKRIIQAQDNRAVYQEFKDIILKAYGEVSPDGLHFFKKDPVTKAELSLAFEQTRAFDTLFMDLFQNPDHAWEFFVDILPEDMKKEIKSKPSDTEALKKELLPSTVVGADGEAE